MYEKYKQRASGVNREEGGRGREREREREREIARSLMKDITSRFVFSSHDSFCFPPSLISYFYHP